jgi:O-antigen/teichoic acid export membrane protein
MSLHRRILFGAAASWVSRGVTVLLGLILMPVLFRHLGREELGVWLLLGQTWSVMGVLDLGLGCTLTRRIALTRGSDGADFRAPLTPTTRQQIADLVASGQRLYQGVALLAFVLSAVGGYFYLRQLHLSSLSPTVATVAWSVLCFSQAFGLWAAVWSCLLQGLGCVGWDTLVVSAVSALVLVGQIVALFVGGNLVVLAGIAAAGATVQRFVLLRLTRRQLPEIFLARGRWDRSMVHSLISPALRAWVTSLGGVIVLNSDQFFIAQLRGPAEIPIYRAAYLLPLNLNMLAVTLASTSSVFVSHLWQAGEMNRIRLLVIRNLKVGLSLMVSGAACILVLGPRLFDFWLQPGHFIGYPVLSVFLLLLTLEAQCFIVSTFSRATEDEAFAATTVIAAVLKIGFSWVLGIKFGVFGVALGTLLAQVFTNHWFMLVRGLARLHVELVDHARQVLAPAGVLFVTTAAAVWAAKALFIDSPAGVTVAAGMAAAGIGLAAGVWLNVLDESERTRLIALLKRHNYLLLLGRHKRC